MDTLKELKFQIRCYGCGAELQHEEPDAAGYVEPERYELKARHKQLRTLLCCRCRALSQGEVLPAVMEGRLRSEGGAGVATPEELRAKLLPVRERKALVVQLIDLTDVGGTLLPRIRELIGGNPVILLGTKADLLPRGTDLLAVEAWLDEIAHKLGGVLHVGVLSAKAGQGMGAAVKAIATERSGRDTFVVGAANVGKSRFISALLEEMNGASARYMPISSATPGTTLGLLPIQAFSGGSQLYDTPGVHLQHRLPALLLPEELKVVAPRGRLKPFTPKQPSQPGTSYFWGGVARFDLVEAPSAMRLTFFAFGLKVSGPVATEEADETYERQAGVELTPPLDAASAKEMGGLVMRRSVELDLVPMRQAADIAVSGLGWISVGCLDTLAAGQRGADGALRVRIDVWVPRGVEVRVRPPMPVGGLPTQLPEVPPARVARADRTRRDADEEQERREQSPDQFVW